MTDSPEPRASLAAITPYVPGRQKAAFDGPIYRMAANENPLGSSEKAREAYLAKAAQLDLYPEGAATSVCEAVGKLHNINPKRIVCGAGSDELLNLLAVSYLGPGDEAIYTRHGFLVYRTAILIAGAEPIIADEVDETVSVDEILAKVTERTKVVFLANPNNPTGTWLAQGEVERLRKALPDHVLLIVDAAYAEYVRQADYEPGIKLVEANDNVVMTRTFSKIYGLAALRLGWLYASSAIVEVLHKVRGPFNVNAAAIEAGVAALEDQDFVARSQAYNQEWILWLSNALRELGLRVTPSVGNFILIHLPGVDGEVARELEETLKAQGILVRGMAAYAFPNAIRASLSTPEGNRALVKAVTIFLDERS